MKILVLVNDVAGMVARQTTTLLVMAATRRGHEVWLCGVSELSWSTAAGLQARARKVGDADKAQRLVQSLRQRTPKALDVMSCDLVLIRTNPARDTQHASSHDVALHLLAGASERGLIVLNDPATLRRAATKVYLTELPPEVVPALLVSRDAREVAVWVRGLEGRAVIKPVRGTRGQDVFLVDEAKSNLHQIIDVVKRDGFVMAQAFVTGGEAGDQRVLVVDGAVLTIDGRSAAMGRVPAGGDFRSNLAAGGAAQSHQVEEGQHAAVARIAEMLRRDGLFFVGVDFIGDQIIELNVFSPGGAGSAMEHQGVDFAAGIVEHLEAEVGRRRAPPAS